MSATAAEGKSGKVAPGKVPEKSGDRKHKSLAHQSYNDQTAHKGNIYEEYVESLTVEEKNMFEVRHQPAPRPSPKGL